MFNSCKNHAGLAWMSLKALLFVVLCGYQTLSAQVIIIEADIPLAGSHLEGETEVETEGEVVYFASASVADADLLVAVTQGCNVYPSPVQDKMTIQFSEYVDLSRVSLINDSGATVFDATTGYPYPDLTATNICAGTYTLSLETSSGTITRVIQVVD